MYIFNITLCKVVIRNEVIFIDSRISAVRRYWVVTGATEEQAKACEEYFISEGETAPTLVYDEASCAIGGSR